MFEGRCWHDRWSSSHFLRWVVNTYLRSLEFWTRQRRRRRRGGWIFWARTRSILVQLSQTYWHQRDRRSPCNRGHQPGGRATDLGLTTHRLGLTFCSGFLPLLLLQTVWFIPNDKGWLIGTLLNTIRFWFWQSEDWESSLLLCLPHCPQMCFLYFRVRKTASGWNVLNADANGHSLKLPEGDQPERDRSAYTALGSKVNWEGDGCSIRLLNVKVKRKIQPLWALVDNQNGWVSWMEQQKICKNILLFSLTFTFCRLCQCGLGGNEAAFANTSSIHFKSSQRQKCQISIWIKCARVWFIYSLKSIISFCKPNITNCLETSKEFRIILEENRFLFWDTVLNWIQSE